MALVASQIANKAKDLLAANIASAGAQVVSASGITMSSLSAGQVVTGNVPNELAEKSAGARYPLFRVSCARVTNAQREKFRTFSGEAEMVIETAVTQDRLENIEDQLHACVEAVTSVLETSRGDWGSGAIYNGGYEVTFGPVKHGGKNFLQCARVSFIVDVSK